MPIISDPATGAELRSRIDHEWRALRPALDALPEAAFDRVIPIAAHPVAFECPTTLRQAVAIVAFWVETAPPVTAWCRGRPELRWEAWYGGDERWEGWPRASVHHAREAAWAGTHDRAEILARLDAAQERAVAALAGLSDEELFRENDLGEWGRTRIADKYRSCVYRSHASLTAALPGS